MSCLFPFRHSFFDAISQSNKCVMLPCGRCVNCLKRKQNDWYLRMVWELRRHSQAVFFTLTYNDDTVPFSDYCYRTCRKKDVQDWLKRGRELYFKHVGKRFDFKYFICSEYGPHTFRPHYHGIIFGISYNDFMQYFAHPWQVRFGYTTQSELWSNSQGACRYVSKYCVKGKMFDYYNVKKGFVEKPWRIVSKGFGENYVFLNKDFHLSNDIFDENERVSAAVRRSRLFLNGFTYSLPRYYRDKIFGTGQEEYEPLLFRRNVSFSLQSNLYQDYLRELHSLQSRGFREQDILRYFKDKERKNFVESAENYRNLVRFYNKSKF